VTVNPGFPRQVNPQWVLLAVVLALPIAGLGGCLAADRLANVDTLWDEAVDLEIARGLVDAPLAGGDPLDPSQFRLPMYVTAVAGWLGTDLNVSLSRGISIVAGMLTILAVALLAALLFDAWTGVLAAMLLAFSPYFLSFMRIGMTEGDIFAALLTTVALLVYVVYLRRPTVTWWCASAVVLGLALGSKFFCIFLIPVFGVLSRTTYSEPTFLFSRDPNDVKRLRRIIALGYLAVAMTLGFAIVRDTKLTVEGAQVINTICRYAAIVAWLIVVTIWGVAIGFALTRSVIDTSLSGRFYALVGLAGLTFFALLPVHALQPAILKEIVVRTITWDGRVPLALWSDHLRLYAGIVSIKATIPVGVFTVLAILNAMTSEVFEGRWRPCLFAVMFYIPMLCFLPLRQTFYLMPIYPALMILTAAMMVSFGRWAWGLGQPYGIVAVIILLVIVGNLGLDSRRVAPNYHIYGYEMIGERWLGAEARGYRNLIQTPSDGVESLVRWCLDHAESDAAVVSYLWEDRIIRELFDKRPPPFRFVPRGVTEQSDELPEMPSLLDADYVLLHVNNLLGYGDRAPDHPPLELLQLGFEKVHTVRRGALEVGWVYRHKR